MGLAVVEGSNVGLAVVVGLNVGLAVVGANEEIYIKFVQNKKVDI